MPAQSWNRADPNLVARAKRESGGSGTCYTGSYGTIIQLD